MDPIRGKYFFIMRLIAASMFMGVITIFADPQPKRPITVSLHDDADQTMCVMIEQGPANPTMMSKNQIYTMQISNVAQFGVFKGVHGRSLSYPIDPSTTSIVLSPTYNDLGLGLKVEQKSTFSYLYSLLVQAIFQANG